MSKRLSALLALACCLSAKEPAPAYAGAPPVTGSGAEIIWTAPKEGALLDVAAGQEKSVSLQSSRKLPERGWLVATLHSSEIAWVHLDGDPDGRSVRFAFLGGGASGAAALEATPEQRSPGDFLLTAPLAAGPLNRLALSVRAGQAAPRAQIWVGSVKSPGFRWELWEEMVKKWANHPDAPPPSPPDLAGEPLVPRLALIRDALALAQQESGRTDAEAVSALLRAEALLSNLPIREPSFPYFRRSELTTDLAKSRKIQKLEDQKMMEVVDTQPLSITIDGPTMLRIESRTQFANTAQHRSAPLQLVLRSEGRLIGLGAEDVLPIAPKDPKDQAAEEARLSSRRRIVVATAPGRHTYELTVRGGPAWVSVISHTRTIHAEQLTNRAEDIPRMLKRAQSLAHGPQAASALALLADAEVSYLKLEDAHARQRFQVLAAQAREPRLRAFALLRLAALQTAHEQQPDPVPPVLALLGDAQDEAALRLRNLLIAEHLTHVLADTPPGVVAPKPAVDLLLKNPDALSYMPAHAGPLLRYLPGPRSLALPLLNEAQQRVPLDPLLRHYLGREWYTGTRWAALAAVEMAGAQSVDLLAPPAQLTTCEEASRQGARAYAPLSEKDAELDVPPELAPASSLHRFHLITLHLGTPRVSWAELTLDGQLTRMPLLLPREKLPLALAAGHHRLRAAAPGEKAGSLLGPCALLKQPSDIALLMEHRFSSLIGRGAHVRVEVPGAGTPGYIGVELRPSASLHGGRVVVRNEQGILGYINVEGHASDPQVVGMNIGPAAMVELPLPAATRALDVVREDSGEPLLVRTLLRRSLATPEVIAPELPIAERGDPALLDELRQATRARRAARDENAVAHAQLKRAEILSTLQSVGLARTDAERALPKLADARALSRTHILLAFLNEPSLVPSKPGGPTAAVMAAGADLQATQAEQSCVTQALSRFASNPAAGRSAAASCKGVLGLYAAARLEEHDGNAEAAARYYQAAYLASLAAGAPRPGLAREAALRYAERGPGPGSQDGLALATAAAQSSDLDGARAVERVRGLSHPRAVRGVDEGEALRAEEGELAPLTLRAALADVPWEAGRFIEVRAGKSAQTNFDAKQPIRLRMDLLCDDSGEPTEVAITPPCDLQVEVDGTPVGENLKRQLRGGEQLRLPDLSLASGPHRIQVTLARRHAVPGPSDGAMAFVHLSTDRPLHGAAARPDTQGYYTVPIAPPPIQRFIATPDQHIQLRVQGPTVLKLDALVQHGAAERSLAIDLTRERGAAVHRSFPVCRQPASPQLPVLQPGYDCRSVITLPLVEPGTYSINVHTVGSPRMAVAMSVFEDERTAGDGGPAPGAEALLAEGNQQVALPANPALSVLPRPEPNWLRAMGTFQVQQLGVISGADKYSETGFYYRRKLEDLPIWLKGGAILHLRQGPASFGLDGRAFARIPVIQLRVSAELQGFTQAVNDSHAFALGFHGYLERSFQVVPHLFILPRFAFTANYQSLESQPIDNSVTGGLAEDGAAVSAAVTPVDPSIYNSYDAAHRTAIYGQVIVWWVPFINMIVYANGRLTSNQNVHQLDSVRGRLGFDLAIKTTELVSYYEIAQFLVDDARTKSVLQHRLGAEIGQTIWLNRNHRLGLLLSANIEATTRETTFIFGAFWEGSRSRGLDDYSTPEINLPQQLGQGRGSLKPEETLR